MKRRELVKIATIKLTTNTKPACFDKDASRASNTSVTPCSGKAFSKRLRISANVSWSLPKTKLATAKIHRIIGRREINKLYASRAESENDQSLMIFHPNVALCDRIWANFCLTVFVVMGSFGFTRMDVFLSWLRSVSSRRSKNDTKASTLTESSVINQWRDESSDWNMCQWGYCRVHRSPKVRVLSSQLTEKD